MKSVFKRVLMSMLVPAPAMLAVSCADEGPRPEPSLVVEGMIDSGGYPSVLLTMTALPDHNPVDVADIVVRHASVSVTDLSDGSAVMLSAGIDERYFPPYRYYTSELRGVAGHTYRICVRYSGREAVSECAMPAATPIDSVTQAPVAGTDTLRALTLHLTAPPDCPAYYHVSTRVDGSDPRYLPGVLGTAEAVVPGNAVTIPVMRAKTSTDRRDRALHMPVGRTVDIRLERVTREVYDFWRAFDNATLVGDSQFIGMHESLPGNVGGAYGVWSACGVDFRRVDVK
ncbi:MAG: DUF4249 domain-containing protein [Bacteroides sp.]|nr:DUF4249 domain-containing protein [Bacteroides sp.]MCM1095102.1 DUF4249 domain-containing protein [Terasakiella sp.]